MNNTFCILNNSLKEHSTLFTPHLEERIIHAVDQIKLAKQFCDEQNVAFCLVLPWLCGAEELNHIIERLRETMQKEFENKCYLLDFEPMFLTKKHRMDWFIWDGVHPKAETYEALGNFASPLLEKWVREKTT